MADADQEIFEQLYRQHFRRVLRYALARVEPERAKDVTAETFLIAWRRLPEVPDEPASWLLGVARRVIAGQARSDARRKALGMRLQAAWDAREGPGDPADQVADRDVALAALSRLGEADREALMLVAWDGLATAAAAAVLGISRLAFAVRLHRARKRLAAELAAHAERITPGSVRPGHADPGSASPGHADPGSASPGHAAGGPAGAARVAAPSRPRAAARPAALRPVSVTHAKESR